MTLAEIEPGTRCQVRTVRAVYDPCVVKQVTHDRLMIEYVRVNFDNRGRMSKSRKSAAIPFSEIDFERGGVRTYQEGR